MTVSSEQQAVERAVATYEHDGYNVQRDVALSSLDARLPADVRVDLVATRGDELVLVEVKGTATAPDAPLAQISAAAELLKNARAELVWAGETVPFPDNSVIQSYSAQAQDVYNQSAVAGLLLAWAALEGAVERVSLSQELQPRVPLRQALSNLYGNRIISWSAYSRLMRLSRTRDALVHAEIVEVDREDFANIQAYTIFFGSPRFVPYDDALGALREVLTPQQAGELLPLWLEHDSTSRVALSLRRVLPASMPHPDVSDLLAEVAEGPPDAEAVDELAGRRSVKAEGHVDERATSTSSRWQPSRSRQSFGLEESTSGGLALKLDKAYEGKSLSEIADAPVEALQGISEGDAKHLKDAFNIKTVRDMGTNKYFLWAQSIAKIAE